MSKTDACLLHNLLPPLLATEFLGPLWGSLILHPGKPDYSFSSFNRTPPVQILSSVEPKGQSRPKGRHWDIFWGSDGDYDENGDPTAAGILSPHLPPPNSDHGLNRLGASGAMVHMTAPADRFEALLKKHEWRNQALDFIKKHPDADVFFVTDVWVVCKDRKTAYKTASSEPGSPSPTPQNGDIEEKTQPAEHNELVIDFTVPQIASVGCYPVTVSKRVDALQTGFKSLRMKLGALKAKALSASHELYDRDTGATYELSLGNRMVRGDAVFHRLTGKHRADTDDRHDREDGEDGEDDRHDREDGEDGEGGDEGDDEGRVDLVEQLECAPG
ncbi:hypothetical protein B0T26DRAFT_755069 [Lasiosphaeria miniovina]|uniref:Uncharacterized protein n=1 Tax=Lasiosphaeria miniovina TaxID=1954250 RepID=A0AA40A605_9PEZI|nr:uncharacterized protein B0T26DRAFT_755069 [Lasiosphaeria miniovina]KAK0709937.1 hypothetical protein B0T26DRAFT_755069 [Lasiosphaeria miniovina]